MKILLLGLTFLVSLPSFGDTLKVSNFISSEVLGECCPGVEGSLLLN